MASSEVEKSDHTPHFFWGIASAIAVVVPTEFALIGVAAVKGAIQLGKGGEFKKEWDRVIGGDDIEEKFDRAFKWGDENGDFLTKTAINGAVGILTGQIGRHARSTGGN